MFDEEYFEWVDVLTAVASAVERGAEAFSVVEVGSGPIAIWGVRAAVALHRLAPRHVACNVLAIEPMDHREWAWLAEHASSNLPQGRCNIATSTDVAGSDMLLADIMDAAAPHVAVWDLMDIDTQGAELQIIRNELHELRKRVRILHVSTHGREIHQEILTRLLEAGWVILVQYPSLTATNIRDYGPLVTMDGHITATPA